MLIQVSAKNFRSIKEEQIFSMLPAPKVGEMEENVITIDKMKSLLKTAVIYGANASGKSNVLLILYALQHLVVSSKSFEVEDKILPYEPYQLDVATQNSPTELSIEFIAKDNIRYIYEIAFNDRHFLKEKLVFFPKGQPSTLYERVGDNIKFGTRLSGRKKFIADSLYNNQLFLSTVRTEKNEQLLAPYNFFSNGLFVSTQINEEALIQFYTNKIAKGDVPNFQDNVNKLLNAADTGIIALTIEERPPLDGLPEDMGEEEKKEIIETYKYRIRTQHALYDKGVLQGYISFRLREESTGTIKLLSVGGLVLEALADGQVLVIDEFDKSLHPDLVGMLIKLFHNPDTNPYNAQLIFATHNTSLLSQEIFRRDQVWFVDKNFRGESRFYSLSDFTGIRKDIPFEKWYLTGKFNAKPAITEKIKLSIKN